jgi:hypothetical protein
LEFQKVIYHEVVIAFIISGYLQAYSFAGSGLKDVERDSASSAHED